MSNIHIVERIGLISDLAKAMSTCTVLSRMTPRIALRYLGSVDPVVQCAARLVLSGNKYDPEPFAEQAKAIGAALDKLNDSLEGLRLDVMCEPHDVNALREHERITDALIHEAMTIR